MNQPALVFGVLNLAVIGTDSLKLQLDVALVGSANVEARLLDCRLEKDLVLDHVTVLIGRYPGGASAQNGLIILLVITLSSSHNDELIVGRSLGVGLMGELIHVIVDYLTQINECTLVKLQSCGWCHLQS